MQSTSKAITKANVICFGYPIACKLIYFVFDDFWAWMELQVIRHIKKRIKFSYRAIYRLILYQKATCKPTKNVGLLCTIKRDDQVPNSPYKSNAHAIAQALAHCFWGLFEILVVFLILATIANAILVHILFLTANIVLFMRKLIRLCY